MPRPKNSATGKVTEFRTGLDYLRRVDQDGLATEVGRVQGLYLELGSIKALAKELAVGKRTLERAIRDVPELRKAINDARVRMGRP